ncbi:Phosphoserine transaminase [Dimargaris verticillata]|uniref:Phosphoserine aminotransferase n=1 Tax=Dimargaris verticillata TaxID=2761393 RepID=A0A9W8B589_9FUNG|nr:Phosphoserine transaminase [Dimargaris verticillata]
MPNSPPTVHNFGAGPSVLPRSVLQTAQAEFLNFADSGMSVLELSHRSEAFDRVMRDTERSARQLLAIPDDYSVLFLQGGASTQFAAVWYNLMASKVVRDRSGTGQTLPPVDYLITGTWSKRAAQEASRLGAPVNVVFDASTDETTGQAFTGIPARNRWQFSGPSGRDAAYVYYCDNETVHGVEWDHVPEVHPDTVLVCDMSSNIMSRPVDVRRFGVILAGAQKNMGPAGVTMVIVRNDLLTRTEPASYPAFPTMLDYLVAQANRSLYNTPPTFTIYLCGLVYQWIKDQGGVVAMAQQNEAKLALLRQVLAHSSLYRSPIDPRYQSRMNVVINLTKPELEGPFLQQAQARHMVQLKGHRSIGGIRVSLYNALPLTSVQALVRFMTDFEHQVANQGQL